MCKLDLSMFSETVTLLFEVTELSHVSPALVTRCGLIHCPETTVGWKSIFRSWMKGAHAKWDITNRGQATSFAFLVSPVSIKYYIYLVLTVGSLNIRRFLGKGAKVMRTGKTAKEEKLSLFSSPPGLHPLKSPFL